MYKLFTAALIGLALPTFGQSYQENFIQSWKIEQAGYNYDNIDALTLREVAYQEIQYFDGLGRLKQIVEKQNNNLGFDLIKPIVLNYFHQDETNLLPYSDWKSNGEYRSNYNDAVHNFYLARFGDDFPKAPIKFESNPLRRVVEEGSPGAAWQLGTNSKKINYLTNNNVKESLSVKCWKVNNDNCSFQYIYSAGDLNVKEIIDNDGNTQLLFYDKRETLILKRVKLDNNFLDTYYVYDDRELLRYVIPPEVVNKLPNTFGPNDDLVNKYIYYYKYDNFKRLIEKKMPGKDYEYFVYNINDQLILYQSGLLRSLKKWQFSKYDSFGRMIISGLTNRFGAASRMDLQSAANQYTQTYEILQSPASYPTFYLEYYSNRAFPVIDDKMFFEIQNIYFFDRYTIFYKEGSNTVEKPILLDLQFVPSPDNLTANTDQVAGLLTISISKIENAYLTSVNYYDRYSRIIQTHKKNHLNGADRYDYTYQGLTNRILKKSHFHYSYPKGSLFSDIESIEYTYFNNGNKSSYTITGYGIPKETVKYGYDDINLTRKTFNHLGTYLTQTIDYSYNIRGWLTKINDPDNISLTSDFFGMKISYNEIDPALKNVPSFSGNISSIVWNTVNPDGILPFISGKKNYIFEYDDLHRMEIGEFSEFNNGIWTKNNLYSEGAFYDNNGNITKLLRNGLLQPHNNLGVIDILTYHYNGNQIVGIDDAVLNNNINDFYDNGSYYNPLTPEYTYDKNGNLTKDSNKEIVSIKYNDKNLPISIEKTGLNRIEYLYDANGELKQQLEYNSGLLQKTTDFIENYVFMNGYPAWKTFEDGRFVYNDRIAEPEFFITDHLGNVRLTYKVVTEATPKNIITQANAYYPYGMSIKELSNNMVTNIKSWKNEYKYNGKMYQDEIGLNWYYYGARFYDPVVARWWTADPLAEKRPYNSPYAFCANNPILYLDPDGQDYFYYNDQGEMVQRVQNDKPDQFYLRQTKSVREYREKTLDDGSIVREKVFVDKTVDTQIDMNSDLGYMIRTVYAESAGENLDSKLAVAEVIRNRANDNTPNSADNGWAAIFKDVDTYKEVVTQPGQFESVQSKALRYSNPTSMLKDEKGNRIESETTALSESVGASIKATRQNTNTTQGAVYFYSPYIKAPSWTTKLQQVNVPGVNNNAFRLYKFK